METAPLVMIPQPHRSSRPVGHRRDRHFEAEASETVPHGRPYPPSPIPAYGAPNTHVPEISEGLRNRIATRVSGANFEHCRAAWARRRSDPIGPHITIYLYAN